MESAAWTPSSHCHRLHQSRSGFDLLGTQADVLCDRIAILADGRLAALGSSLDLKTQYGAGYTLTVVLDSPDMPIRCPSHLQHQHMQRFHVGCRTPVSATPSLRCDAPAPPFLPTPPHPRATAMQDSKVLWRRFDWSCQVTALVLCEDVTLDEVFTEYCVQVTSVVIGTEVASQILFSPPLAVILIAAAALQQPTLSEAALWGSRVAFWLCCNVTWRMRRPSALPGRKWPSDFPRLMPPSGFCVTGLYCFSPMLRVHSSSHPSVPSTKVGLLVLIMSHHRRILLDSNGTHALDLHVFSVRYVISHFVSHQLVDSTEPTQISSQRPLSDSVPKPTHAPAVTCGLPR